jgi:Protein of unknown function (DUF2914)/Tetratricopeptide repeat
VTDVLAIQPLMERAEQAAHRGDFAAAEEALRLAVELQERTLGASSPEVASTLNNLGIVYERLNRPAEAESCYRKSFAIATAAFAPDHPLVETSATNLREFCDARGIPFEQPEPAPVSARVETPAAATPARPPRDVPPEPVPATSSGSSRRPIVTGAVIVLAVAAAVFFSSRRKTSPVTSTAPSAAAVPAAPVVEPEAAAPPPAPAPVPVASPPAATSEPVSKPSAPPQTAPRVAMVEILDARLCRSLDLEANWRCDPLPESAVSGPVFFVTRLKSATDTSVEHRWYRDNKLSQSVTLRVGATGSGYRTYSRMTASPDRPGTWRVEVRAANGAVLDQKTFVVGPP